METICCFTLRLGLWGLLPIFARPGELKALLSFSLTDIHTEQENKKSNIQLVEDEKGGSAHRWHSSLCTRERAL